MLRPGEHAAAGFARAAAVRPARDAARALVIDRDWRAHVPSAGSLPSGPLPLVVHAGSGALEKNWHGFPELIERWQRRGGFGSRSVVVLRGPAEVDRPRVEFPGTVTLDGLTLPQLAGVLASAGRYLGNDSGVSHLAAAVSAPGLALFGASDPHVWHPLGSTIRVVAAPATSCGRCGPAVFCRHRLSVDDVLRTLDGCVARGQGTRRPPVPGGDRSGNAPASAA
jgi:ADP-heptose:LPS heptosyltransferase